jgi:hypothetical protein
MKTNGKLIGLTIAIIALLSAEAGAADSIILKTKKDKENYTTGVTIVRNLKNQGGVINLDIVIKGMMDELTGYLLLTEEDIRLAEASIKAELTQKKQLQAEMKQPGEMKAAIEDTTPILNAERDGDSSVSQNQRPEKTNEQVGQGGLLASGRSAVQYPSPAPQDQRQARTNVSPVNNIPETGQGQPGPNQQMFLAPNGSALSARNQAKLSVMELKETIRAKAFEMAR